MAVAVGMGGHTVKCSPLWSGHWSQYKLLGGNQDYEVGPADAYTSAGLSESPVHPKGKTPQPLKRHCGPARERASACHHGTLQAET